MRKTYKTIKENNNCQVYIHVPTKIEFDLVTKQLIKEGYKKRNNNEIRWENKNPNAYLSIENTLIWCDTKKWILSNYDDHKMVSSKEFLGDIKMTTKSLNKYYLKLCLKSVKKSK